ncbi:hypothetical protein LR48_Vigan03g208000 [Vigna angularis]|uniref:Uncharacterized protein n=1 Tax=Phaseolus angularis TaxID=3914 RepID=A0A0L9U7B5_PHAAN|nr:hypothetical protein LR48_Vigan03g208000 [Vigna angularis]
MLQIGAASEYLLAHIGIGSRFKERSSFGLNARHSIVNEHPLSSSFGLNARHSIVNEHPLSPSFGLNARQSNVNKRPNFAGHSMFSSVQEALTNACQRAFKHRSQIHINKRSRSAGQCMSTSVQISLDIHCNERSNTARQSTSTSARQSMFSSLQEVGHSPYRSSITFLHIARPSLPLSTVRPTNSSLLPLVLTLPSILLPLVLIIPVLCRSSNSYPFCRSS